jgi:Lon protease-like protein
MVRDCLESGTGFGVVFIRDGREVGQTPRALASVGTIAELRQVELHPDGRLDLATVGGSRFAIDRIRTTADGYLMAVVSLLAEPIGDRAAAQRLARRVVAGFARYVTLLGTGAASAGQDTTPSPMTSPSSEASAMVPATSPPPVLPSVDPAAVDWPRIASDDDLSRNAVGGCRWPRDPPTGPART